VAPRFSTRMIIHGDFETRSELDLKEVGLDVYARHPSTDVWCFGWAVDDGEPQIYGRQDAAHCSLRIE
jgi:hypothetical protein